MFYNLEARFFFRCFGRENTHPLTGSRIAPLTFNFLLALNFLSSSTVSDMWAFDILALSCQ